MVKDLGTLYQQAQNALKAKDYDSASKLLQQILQADENYKDTSRLLAQTVKLRRRRWYNHPLLWGTLGSAALVALGALLAPAVRNYYASHIIPPMGSPTVTLTQTKTPIPTYTPLPLVWKRINIGQEFPRDTVSAIAVDPNDPDVIYVGMANAGIYKSINGGASWQPAYQGIASAQIFSLLIDPRTRKRYMLVRGMVPTRRQTEGWIGEKCTQRTNRFY